MWQHVFCVYAVCTVWRVAQFCETLHTVHNLHEYLCIYWYIINKYFPFLLHICLHKFSHHFHFREKKDTHENMMTNFSLPTPPNYEIRVFRLVPKLQRGRGAAYRKQLLRKKDRNKT
jgi:hypothetical protein